MSVTFSKSKGLYKDGIRIQCFFKHDVFTSALSVCRHDNGFISLDFHDDNGIHFIEVTDKDADFLMSCDDSQTAFDYALSLIPPSENTGNKESVPAIGSGVVDSVGVALSVYDFFSDEFDEVGLYEHPAALTQPEPINQKSFIDDDIPPSFFESGIFARAE